jgi:putative FmdB family regulatory protein
MPLYEYECEHCGRRFEKIQRFSDPPADVCPHCGQGPVRKLMSSPAIQFKGSGWYVTDYAKKSGSEARSASGGEKDRGTKAQGDAGGQAGDAGAKSGESGSSSDTSTAAKSETPSKTS